MANGVGTRCFSCLEPRALTVEHVISQALGGRLKRKLYCGACNKGFGETIDAELVKAFGFVSTNLQIQRERGSNRPFEVREVGTNLLLLFDGIKLKRKNPVVKVKKDGEEVEIDVTARSEKELATIMRSVLSRHKLPGPGKAFQEHRAGPVDASFEIVPDSIPIRRGVTKMAYGLLCDKVPTVQVLSPAFDEVRSYIRGRQHLEHDMASANFTHHTEWTCDFVRPLHKIHINYNRRTGLVTGFVTIFGTFRFTVMLSNSYVSPIDWSPLDYTYDPVAQREIEGNANFNAPALSAAQILHPKQSIRLVGRELMRSHRMLATYTEGHRVFDIEFEKPPRKEAPRQERN